MAKKSGKDKNYISIWQWLLLFLLFALPCFGIVFIFYFAFAGDNESRKNYCRATLLLMVLGLLIWGCFVALGLTAVFSDAIQKWIQQHHHR